jgi:hypothetical protein
VDVFHHWTDERTGLRPLQLVDGLRLPRNHWIADGQWDAIANFAPAKSA